VRYRHLRRTVIAVLATVAFVLIFGLVIRAVLEAEPTRRTAIRWIERAAAGYGAEVEIKVDNLCRAVDIPEDSNTVEISKKALKTVGIDARTTFITGFTDASIYNNQGIEVAVVGIGAHDEHSTDEHIAVADMEKALKMIIEIMRLCAE